MTSKEKANDQKLLFFLQGDILRTGSNIEINENTFWRIRFCASNDLSFVDRKLLSSELEQFKLLQILIKFDVAFALFD